MKEIVCIHCGLEFDPSRSRHKIGRYNECGDCADDVNKTIGILVVDGKTDYHIETFECPTKEIQKLVAKAGRCGPTQCHSSLGLNTNGANTPKDSIDRVQENLEKDSSKERKCQQFESRKINKRKRKENK